jgi:hypothetical protein
LHGILWPYKSQRKATNQGGRNEEEKKTENRGGRETGEELKKPEEGNKG